MATKSPSEESITEQILDDMLTKLNTSEVFDDHTFAKLVHLVEKGEISKPKKVEDVLKQIAE